MHEVNVGLAGEKERLKGELKATNEKFSGFCQEVAMR